MSLRSRSREIAMQALYQLEAQPLLDPTDIENFLKRRLHQPVFVDFAKELVVGVQNNLSEIDRELADLAKNWRVERMAATDRAILRMAVYEIGFMDTPRAVVADEAIELSKRYGAASSSRFVAGIVGHLVKHPMKKDQDAVGRSKEKE
ncbi:MAG: transcription antitermination factor NusB [Pirellulales bacterium]|nr:transcription antitermination factor NusB [Pirellulales bacterium]